MPARPPSPIAKSFAALGIVPACDEVRRIAFGRGSEKRGKPKLAESDINSRQLHLWLVHLVEVADRTAAKTGAHGTIAVSRSSRTTLPTPVAYLGEYEHRLDQHRAD